MIFFMQEPLWESQMSTQTTALSDLGDTLIMQGFETNMASVKIEEGGLDLFYFSFYFLFYFPFLEQLGLGLIGHAITSIT